MAGTFTSRDREVSRAIHKLFWQASFVDAPDLIWCYVLRVPAMFVYNVLIPVVVAYGLQAIITKHFEAVAGYAWWIMALALAYCVLWGIGGVVICKNARIGVEWVQRTVFANFLQKDYEFYSDTYMGALGAQAVRIRDSFNEYNQMMCIAIPKQTIIVISSISIIAWQSLLLAGVTLAAMAAVLSFTVYSSRWRMRFRRQLSTASSELSGIMGDALGHGATVKSFAAEDYEEKRLGKSLKEWARIQYRAWMSSIPADLGRMILAAAATGVLLVLTARMYQQNTISIAIVVLVQLYVVRLIASTIEIAEIVKQYEAIMGAAYESMRTILVPQTIKDAEKPRRWPKRGQPSLELQNVTFKYPAQRKHPAVDKFSLDVKPGEKIGLVGYSGSGKTTLTRLLLRFMDVTNGNIRVSGIDIRSIAQRDLRKHIAYVPQEPLLFHRSVFENIAYGRPSASKEQVLAAAKAAYVHEFAKDLPNGYDTLVGERGVKLSGGQRQRVAIARALLMEAPILVLDEATSALDSRSELLIQKALWKLMKGRTAIVIAHRLSTIQRMDRIAVMDKGKITQVGTHEQLLKQKDGIYAQLWAHQSGGYVGAPPENAVA